MIDTIMLFAAGFGNRMRHLTENSPKTLIPILGQPMLHHALSLCRSYPFKRIVINTHYLHDQISKSIENFQELNPSFPEIIIPGIESAHALTTPVTPLVEPPPVVRMAAVIFPEVR